MLVTLLKNQWPVSPDSEDHRRRSIYLFVRRNLRYPIFEAFDRPDTNASCPRRNESTIAPQALMLLNSETSLSAARHLAGIVITNVGGDQSQQVASCYLRTLGRLPTDAEKELAQSFLKQDAQRLHSENREASTLALPIPLPQNTDEFQAAALTDFCLTIFNLNEFIYID